MSSTTLGNLLDGDWATVGGDGELAVTDPSSVDSTVAVVPAMSAADITAVYDAAERGAKVWRHTRPLQRAAVMTAAARLLRERGDAIARELVSEMGKTLAEATVEVAKAADFLDYYASLARLPLGVELADARPNVNVAVRNEPVGIVLLITPWNDPLLTPARKLAPALFAGNAVILKPASETPVVSLRLAEALQRRRPAGRRARHRHRAGLADLGRAARRPATGRGQLHGQHRGGPAAAPRPGRPQRPSADRDGRQERERRAGGRRPRPRRGDDRRGLVRSGRSALHGHQPRDRRSRGRRRAAAEAGRGRQAPEARARPRSGHEHRSGCQPQAPIRGDRAPRARPQRGR